MENEVRQEYLDRWRDVVIAWLLAGVASKGDKAIAWGKPTTKVLAAVWQRMLHWDVPDGFSYCAELQAFRIKRNALRSVLRPDWRQVHARSDAESRKALAGLQREVGVFYRGKPFYELTTKFINTPRFEQLRDGTLTWEELDLPSSIIAEMRDTFFVDTSTTVPYAGAVFVGYEGPDTIYLGVSEEGIIIEFLKYSARLDLRGGEPREGPLAFSPAERAQWLCGTRTGAFLEKIIKRLDPSFEPEPEPLTSDPAFNKLASEIRTAAEQINANRRLSIYRRRYGDHYQDELDDTT